MTLENLLTIRRLQPFDVTPAGLQRLFAHTRQWLQAQRPDLLIREQ